MSSVGVVASIALVAQGFLFAFSTNACPSQSVFSSRLTIVELTRSYLYLRITIAITYGRDRAQY